MTLIGGFRADRGVVLCADSRESDGLAKGEVDKLVEYVTSWCTVGFAGAGNDGDVIDATIEQIVDALDDKKPTNLSDIKTVCRLALAELPLSENSAGLLLAVCPSERPHAELWAIADRHLHSVKSGQQVMGVGQYVRFIAERLYRNDLSLYQAVLMAVHLLGIAKRYVSDVEGTSHVLVLTDGGWLKRERVDEVAAREQFFEWFDAALSSVYLSFADTSITNDEFEQSLKAFSTLVTNLRNDYFEKFKDAHLTMAVSDPTYVGDPYRTLPDNAKSNVGPMAVRYQFMEGVSGWAETSAPSTRADLFLGGEPPEIEIDDD